MSRDRWEPRRPEGAVRRAGATAVAVARRTGWGLADQALSSVTNFGLAVVVARALEPRAFGAFSIVFASYLIALGISRASANDPLVIRFSGRTAETWRRGVRSAAGTALALGIVFGAVAAGASLLAQGPLAQGLLALGLSLPGLLVQDCWRYAFFGAGRGSSAFINDAAWALVLFPSLILVVITGRASVFLLVLIWGLAGTVAAIVGVAQSRVVPALGAARGWLIEQRELAARYVAEFGAFMGATQLALFGITAIAGLVAAGALRAADLLFGPLYVVDMGIRLVALPEAVKLARRSARELRRAVGALSAVLGLAAIAWGAMVLLVPDAAGRAVLGENWESARAIVVPVALGYTAIGAMAGLEIGLRALAAAQRSLRARLLTAPMIIGGGIIGAALGSAEGAAWGLALAAWAGTFVWLRETRRGLADRRALGDGPPGGTA